MIQILLADDHGIVRASLRSILESHHDLKVVGEATTGEETIELVRELRPDVVLMDLNMPGTDGFTASLQLLQSTSPPKILIISGQEGLTVPLSLLQSGVLGYISKAADPKILLEAIRTVYAGKQYFEDHKFLMTSIADSPFAQLTNREMQIIFMMVRGMKTKKIAEKLFLDQKTVQGYVRGILKKLNLQQDIELVHLAIKYKIIDPNTLQLDSEM